MLSFAEDLTTLPPEEATAPTDVTLGPAHCPDTAARSRRASAPIVPGERYERGAVIGRGGMGEVFSAYDAQIGREVAIKQLYAERATPAGSARFLREARIQGRLDHPAIPPVYELGLDDRGRPFFAMKKLAGVTLADILRDRARYARFSQQQLLRAFVEICLAIEFAHSRGIIHRDLKPSNMLLGEFGEVYVLDWGVARVLDDTDPRAADAPREGDGTMAGMALGTPGYMAPEQVRGERDLDARVDVYALGCVLFELLVGRRLHPSGVAGMQSALCPINVRASAFEEDVPPELDELCRRATLLERDERIGSARELGEAVQRYLDGDRDLAQRRALAKSHLEAAQAALATAPARESNRQRAMREAGMALALDPTLPGATELVSRLMIQPPAQTPRAVAEELAGFDAREGTRQARLAAAIYLGYALFAPIFFLLGIRDVGYLAAFAAVSLGNFAIAMIAVRQRRGMSRLAVAIGQAAVIALFARMFTPLFLAPGIAAVTLMVYAHNPGTNRRSVTLALVLGLGAIAGVWGAEALGWISPTIEISADGAIHLMSPLDGIGAFPAMPMMWFYVVTLSVVAAALAYSVARRGSEARHKLHLQAWQLRQLVALPASPSPAPDR